jgi:hypothetical protein
MGSQPTTLILIEPKCAGFPDSNALAYYVRV